MSSDRVSVLLGILFAHPEGMDAADLFAKLRDTWPHLTEDQAQRVLDDAGPVIRVEGTRVSLVTVVAVEPPSTPRVGIRAVALDCETAVRLIPTKPYTDARIFQVAAVRFGTDTKWVEQEPALDRFMRLPEGFDVFDATVTARYEANAADCTEVLEVLRAYLADADVVVAYNSHKADFDFLDRACELADIDRLDEPARCDGLYLALCMYPQGSMPHALRPLADAVGLDTSGMTWHDALDDSIVLARLINHLADRFSAMAQEERALIGALCADSVAWRLLFALAGLGTPQSQAVGDAEVADVIERGLSEAPIRRRAKTSVGAIPATLKGPAGEVDPYRVALAARPDAQIRESQEEMGKVLREWIASGLDGLCEAPTGIGKSYVTIACALDWLEQHPWGRVVIATHTKQLQSQLVSELESLAFGDLAWLRQATGLVKGARNRLSLRALVQALADCSMEVAESRLPRHRMFRTVIHRELLVYLLLRLWATPRNLNDEWESRSVDPMDVPGFFESYTDEHVGRWLLPLSQADADDYHPPRVGRPPTLSAGADAAEMQAQTPEEAGGSMAPPPDPLSTHTEFVPEAIERYRLVVTNHALLMAHLDCVSDPAGTLLIVDEAHAIEGAATEALSQSVSYQTFEQLKSDVEHLSRELSKALDTRGLSEVARSLEEVLRTEMLPHSIQRIFDQVSGPPGVTGALRQGTLASWWGGDQARRDVLRAFSYLRRLSGTVSHLCQICRAISPSLDNLPRSDQQRFWAVRARAETMSTACAEVLGVADAILGPFTPPPAAVASGEQGIGGQTDIADTFEGENQGTPSDENPDGVDTNHIAADEAGDEDVSPVVDDDLSEETADTAPDGRDSPPPPSTRRRLAQNRIVWAAEMPGSDLIHGGRHYHFSLHASPVELPAEPEWARLRPAFARSIWISATLTVAGRFDFIRSRLGFGADVAERRLPASFNYKDHARLYVMSDFPSWSEHEVQAVRTLSWQTAGFCAAVTRPTDREGGADPGSPTPYRAGAMVITTSTSVAASVADRLGADLAARGARAQVHAAVLRGNQRALIEFRERGGVLVGTKGLWTGVDVPEPDRVRLLWVNKLPFAPFADPLIEARRAAVARRAEQDGADDPDEVAQREYYLPLAALELRQGIGRLIRGDRHRGVVLISDRRLAGDDRLRRMYRDIFLGSLDPGLWARVGEDPYGGNLLTMRQAWTGVWRFLTEIGELPVAQRDELLSDTALLCHTVSPETLAVRELALSEEEVARLRATGEESFLAEVRHRCNEVARLLNVRVDEFALRPEQVQVIDHIAKGEDCLALLPTGFGKSYCFQLPALVLPGITVVISPLVALMADQAMALNRTIGGAVRALVAPLRDSSSRAGKAEVAAALRGTGSNEIRLVYISPERVTQRGFREALFAGVKSGQLSRIAIDEAHTLVQWGDDFRPAFRRLEPVISELRVRAQAAGHQLSICALTATANRSVKEDLLKGIFSAPGHDAPHIVAANPIRPEIAVYSRQLTTGGGDLGISSIAEAVADRAPGHLIIYCLTINEVQTTYAQLREWIGAERAWQVQRFHGRLTEAEKSAVLNAFKSAPKLGEEGYYRMIIVATSAFGLGVDRPDVAAVLCLSPPADLAALYQQLGRAGRGLAQGTEDEKIGAVGMALAHRRGWNMVEFLTTTDLPTDVLCDLGRRVLRSDGLVDTRALANTAIDEEVTAGRMSEALAVRSRTRVEYRAGVIRAIAALSQLSAVADHGDLPNKVRVMRGTFQPDDKKDRFFIEAVVNGVASLRTEGAVGTAAVTCRLPDLHAALASVGGVDALDGPAETWVRLLDAHGAGWLDVSQLAPDQSWLCALDIKTHELPPDFQVLVTKRRVRAMDDVSTLRAWFAAQGTCAQQGFADYFEVDLPGAVCATAACRCSRCWFKEKGAATGRRRPSCSVPSGSLDPDL